MEYYETVHSLIILTSRLWNRDGDSLLYEKYVYSCLNVNIDRNHVIHIRHSLVFTDVTKLSLIKFNVLSYTAIFCIMKSLLARLLNQALLAHH